MRSIRRGRKRPTTEEEGGGKNNGGCSVINFPERGVRIFYARNLVPTSPRLIFTQDSIIFFFVGPLVDPLGRILAARHYHPPLCTRYSRPFLQEMLSSRSR